MRHVAWVVLNTPANTHAVTSATVASHCTSAVNPDRGFFNGKRGFALAVVNLDLNADAPLIKCTYIPAVIACIVTYTQDWCLQRNVLHYHYVYNLIIILLLLLIGSEHHCVFLHADDVPPYFKMEPVATQVHLEGNRLVLTCMAEGSWPLEFKWLYNGTELTRFSLEYRWALHLSLLPHNYRNK